MLPFKTYVGLRTPPNKVCSAPFAADNRLCEMVLRLDGWSEEWFFCNMRSGHIEK